MTRAPRPRPSLRRLDRLDGDGGHRGPPPQTVPLNTRGRGEPPVTRPCRLALPDGTLAYVPREAWRVERDLDRARRAGAHVVIHGHPHDPDGITVLPPARGAADHDHDAAALAGHDRKSPPMTGTRPATPPDRPAPRPKRWPPTWTPLPPRPTPTTPPPGSPR